MSAVGTHIGRTIKTVTSLDSSASSASARRVEAAIDKARRCLLSEQFPDGHWCAELQGDTILESEYILLMAFLGRERDDKCLKAAEYLRRQQMPDGGWGNYPGGRADVSVSVKAYFALKLTGHDPSAPYMRKACEVIHSLGGAARCNSFTKFYLALLGQFPYAGCPSVPPEMIFLPRWAYVNLYAMSSWTRTIVVPLSIFYAFKPVRKLPPHLGIAELFLEKPGKSIWTQQPHRRLLSWHNFFLTIDQLLKVFDSKFETNDLAIDTSTGWGSLKRFVTHPLTSIRARAVQAAAKWMIDHFEDSDGVGAIFPPMIYTVISLHCLGYGEDSPEMHYALKQLDDLMIEENDNIRLQPCFSPVWDTAIALNALACVRNSDQSGAIAAGVRWLLDREVRRAGDWTLMQPELQPGGWFFEYRNGFYPDTDDTAMVLMALARTGHAFAKSPQGNNGHATELRVIPPVQRALDWLLGMQNSDGGWAAFDRDINRDVLEKIPFADHNAMLDPSCPDITARVLEALGQFGYRVGDPSVDRGIRFIEKTQDPRGCWIGRWGVNYIYGTWQVLLGLDAVHFDMQHPMVRRAVRWLKAVQQAGGGWGETCQSYDDPALAGQGVPTASQSAWALLGLMAAGEAASPEVAAGIQYLLSTQGKDGNWEEEQFTGTGFPRVFYLKYHYYRLYFPLMALARYHANFQGFCRNGVHHNGQVINYRL